MYVREKEFYAKLKEKYATVPEYKMMNGTERIPCPMENCESYFSKSKVLNFRLHLEYHEILKSQNRSYHPTFPCVHCPMTFDDYQMLSQHAVQEHPRFTYQCIVPNCAQRGTSYGRYERRRDHFYSTHRDAMGETTAFICEVINIHD